MESVQGLLYDNKGGVGLTKRERNFKNIFKSLSLKLSLKTKIPRHVKSYKKISSKFFLKVNEVIPDDMKIIGQFQNFNISMLVALKRQSKTECQYNVQKSK